MINNPVAFSIDYLADASKDIPNMVVQLSFLEDARGTGQWHQLKLMNEV